MRRKTGPNQRFVAPGNPRHNLDVGHRRIERMNPTSNSEKWSFGWFGGQLGGTAWMLFLCLASPPIWSLVSVSGFVVFALVNLVGFVMWTNQARLDQHICVQILIAVIGLGTFALLALMDATGCVQQWDPRIQNPKSAYLMLLIFPAMSAWMHVINKRNTHQKMANHAMQADGRR